MTYLDLVFSDRPGYVAMALGYQPYRDDNGKYRHKEWRELPFIWPGEKAKLLRTVEQEMATGDAVDVYVAAALRNSPGRNGWGGKLGSNAAPPRVLWADLDGPVDLAKLTSLDAYLVDSGQPGHRHLYLLLDRPVDVATHRALNRALAQYLGADSKWSDDALLRLPGTQNWKPTVPAAGVDPGPASAVRVVKANTTVWSVERIADFLDVDLTATNGSKPSSASSGFTGHTEPAPDPLPTRVQAALNHTDIADRSKAHARLVGACLDTGLTIGQTVTVCSTYRPSAEKYGDRLPDEVGRFWSKALADRSARATADEPDTDESFNPVNGSRGGGASDADEDDEPLRVVSFPVLSPNALCGLPGKIVAGVSPHTEAHQAPILFQYLARFGCSVGRNPYVRVANTRHHARLWPLIIGHTSDGAKGTSEELVKALFRGDGERPNPVLEVNRTSGLSSGEGLITPVRDPSGEEGSKGYDEGVEDKRLLVVETEFAGTLKVMDRQGSSLDRVFRQSWDGDRLQTMTKSPQVATDPHIVMIAHASPGELRATMTDTQLAGGTMNRTIPCASRRVRLLSDGGNLPAELITQFNKDIEEAMAAATKVGEVTMSPDATALWKDRYASLRRSRPEGPVAKMLARSAPQVIRIALTYTLADKAAVIEHQHLTAALAMWDYAEQTALWMFGSMADPAEMDDLEKFIAASGRTGRTRTEINVEHFKKHKKSAEIKMLLVDLLKSGRIRQDAVPGAGRTATRYSTC